MKHARNGRKDDIYIINPTPLGTASFAQLRPSGVLEVTDYILITNPFFKSIIFGSKSVISTSVSDFRIFPYFLRKQ